MGASIAQHGQVVRDAVAVRVVSIFNVQGIRTGTGLRQKSPIR